MVFESFHIGCCFVGWDTLIDLNNDIGEAIWIQIDFLMVWNLSNLADNILEDSSNDYLLSTYLTSAKPAGKSVMRAPPNNAVDLKVDILILILVLRKRLEIGVVTYGGNRQRIYTRLRA
jgi:hypothetical protein